MEDSEHGLWDDLKYQWGCVGRRRGKVGGRDGWEGEIGIWVQKQYNGNVSCTHYFLTCLPDVADQLPVVVCRHTSQVRAACLVDPLAGEVESCVCVCTSAVVFVKAAGLKGFGGIA